MSPGIGQRPTAELERSYTPPMTTVGLDQVGDVGEASATVLPARRTGQLTVAALASTGAAVLHAAAAGAHSDPASLARIFIVTALLQGAAAVAGFLWPGLAAALALVGVNAAAFGGWLTTRLTGLSDIPGLEVAEAPGLADSATAALAVIAVVAAVLPMLDRAPAVAHRGAASAAVLVAALVTPAMFAVTTHEHAGHSHDTAAAAGEFDNTPFVGTLENGGVGLAPFHDFEGSVSPDLQAELDAITAGIIDGSIPVESPASPK